MNFPPSAYIFVANPKFILEINPILKELGEGITFKEEVELQAKNYKF